MGATCGVVKKPREKGAGPKRVIVNTRTIRSERLDPTKSKRIEDIDPKDANIGSYFFEEDLFEALPKVLKRKWETRLQKWHRMSGFDPSADYVDPAHLERTLETFFQENPKVFIRRVCKGPPPRYRWMAWKIICRTKGSQVAGTYQELLSKEEPNNKDVNQLKLDLHRTLPKHPFFDKSKYGEIG